MSPPRTRSGRRPQLPAGFRVAMDPRSRVVAGGAVVIGGEPRRALRLTEAGARALARLRAGEPVRDAADGALGRRLVDAGLAVPQPGAIAPGLTLAVVVPVLDRGAELAGCLAALGAAPAVVVVDDGSRDGAAVDRVAQARGARVIRRRRTGGPAAARNAGLAAVTADVVAFVDCDARVTAAALRALLAHFADPCVAAVAPRIRAITADRGVLARFAAARSPLDMGPRAGGVRTGGPPYVPSTVLLVRRSALAAIGGFDRRLRYGEDVDAVWRLVRRGWSVRYDPTVTATHGEPATWPEWLRRRYRYGTSAGPLGRRHAELMRGPALSGLVAPVTVLRALPRLRGHDLPARAVLAPAVTALPRTVAGVLRWAVPLWWPVVVAGADTRRGRRLAALALATPALLEWWERRPALDPVRYVAAALADDAAYGAGVWRGCLRARTAAPLLPRLRRPLGLVNRG